MDFAEKDYMDGGQMNNPKPMPRVSVIDDEHIIADTLAEILKLHGYEAKAYYDGESALADAQDFCPQVVLSDIRMQKIDGIETALRFREFHPPCRVILFTATPMSGELYERISGLGFEFLQRPLHPQEVVALLREDTSVYRAPATGELLRIETECHADHHQRGRNAARGSRDRQADVKCGAVSWSGVEQDFAAVRFD